MDIKIGVEHSTKPPVLVEEGEGLPYCTAKYLRTGEIESIVPIEAWDKSIINLKNSIGNCRAARCIF